jgi:biopolymer transport protein ExbB
VAVLALGLSALAQAPAGGNNGGASNVGTPGVPATGPALGQSGGGSGHTNGKDLSVFQLFLKGGPVMWVLAACSVFALAIMIERLFALRRSAVIPGGFMHGLKTVAPDPLRYREQALEYCRTHDSPIARMVAAGVKKMPRGHDAAEKAIEDAGGNEALKLRQNMRMLYAIGSIATLLGLIGTIAGMIKAFQVTAAAGDAPNKVELLSTGIYEAMVCTFGGLFVAIICTAGYYYFAGRIERLIGDINDELTTFSEEYGLNAESQQELSAVADLTPPPLGGRTHMPAVTPA